MSGPGAADAPADPQEGVGAPDAFRRLWTPHRMAYIKGEGKPAGDGCPFCEIPALDDAEGLVVARGEHCYAVLNLYPYNAGHLLVCPYRHIADYTETTDDEAAEMADLTRTAMRTLRAVSGAMGFNVGHEPGLDRRGRHRGAPAPARGAALGRGHQLHAGRRADEGAPAAAARHPRDARGRLGLRVDVAGVRPAPARHPPGDGGRRVRVVLRLVVVVVFLAPAALLLTGSLRRAGSPPPPGLGLLPESPTLGSYRALGDLIPVLGQLGRSLTVVAVAVPVTVLVASWAGFALAQLAPRPRRLLLVGTVALLLVPLPMLWVARFVLFLHLGVLDTLIPLMAPALAATTPFTVLLAYRAFRGVPPTLWEAARCEGAGAFTTWWRVGLPLTRATTTAIGAVAFVFHWGNYLDALLYAQSERSRTLPLGVGELAGLDSTQLPVLLAGAALLAVPPLLAARRGQPAAARRRGQGAAGMSPALPVGEGIAAYAVE